jgi:hypothetical protein
MCRIKCMCFIWLFEYYSYVFLFKVVLLFIIYYIDVYILKVGCVN